MLINTVLALPKNSAMSDHDDLYNDNIRRIVDYFLDQLRVMSNHYKQEREILQHRVRALEARQVYHADDYEQLQRAQKKTADELEQLQTKDEEHKTNIAQLKEDHRKEIENRIVERCFFARFSRFAFFARFLPSLL